MSPLALVIGNKNSSSWSLRPWLVLEHSGIPFVEHLFLFETPTWRDDVAKLSPSRRVPALRHDGIVIAESLAICEYLAELHPEKKLWPDDRAARAVARSVSNEMHAGFAALRNECPMDVVGREGGKVLSSEALADVRRVEEIWRSSRAQFGSGGPFLFGTFSIADAMFAPVVWRFRTYGIATDVDWYHTMLALPAMKKWEHDSEREVSTHPVAKDAVPHPRSAQHLYAVIFTSQRTSAEGYDELATRMVALAKEQPGFVGIESARSGEGFGITVSYWDSLQAIKRWKDHAEHRIAQAKGRNSFYSRYDVRVCTVDRGYRFP